MGVDFNVKCADKSSAEKSVHRKLLEQMKGCRFAFTALTQKRRKEDENFFIAFDGNFEQTASMTKQLTTTTSVTTIANSNLAPTAISPTTPLTTTNSNSPITGTLRKCSSNTTIGIAPTSTLPATGLVTPVTVAQAKPTAPVSSSAASNDASGRSAALERAYVHDVYENCEEPTGPIRPRVAQFLSNLEPGSVVCDVGCGSGRYLTHCNPAICTVGVDRCHRLSKVAKEKGGEVALCDNLELPFRDESFDAVLSLAVVHHFATTERRVSALRELARILRIGGRVVITVWALEQRHRRFESQDVLIPWQPPKNRNYSYSDEEDDDDFLPPYHAYIEDSTNSSRSAGDGDSSSLSSSSPGESCYSFVRRAIQKLAGGRKHAWFLDSWTSKETKNDSSLDYEDAKDLPIELRRLDDFDDFPDPPLSAGLKSRSLGSILNPPPRQIVRSRSSVPSLGGPLLHAEQNLKSSQNAQFLSTYDGHNSASITTAANGHSPTGKANVGASASASSSLGRRPKLIKQKQSLCDEDYQLPENPFHMISSYNSSSNSVNNGLYMKSGCYYSSTSNQHPNLPLNLNLQQQHSGLSARQLAQASIFLRKQSSLNEELMAANRIREKERVRKRIQKQMSLNEAFLCRSALFSKRLQVIREGFTTKIKSSTGSLERATKNGLTKIIQNFKSPQTANGTAVPKTSQNNAQQHSHCPHPQHHSHHHHHHHFPQMLYKQSSCNSASSRFAGPVVYCNNHDCATTACYCSTYHHICSTCNSNSVNGNEDAESKARRCSRESGSDSSKDSSLQSDTSIESEDSFASVIFIPKPEQHQQQLNYQQQHQNSNSSSSNSSSSNGGCQVYNNCCQRKSCNQQQTSNKMNCMHVNGQQQQTHYPRIPSVPTSPLIMPCPPTPAHSPAAAQAAVTSPPQTIAAVTAAMAILTPPSKPLAEGAENIISNGISKNRFNFDEAHIKQHDAQTKQQQQQESQTDIKKSEPEILSNASQINSVINNNNNNNKQNKKSEVEKQSNVNGNLHKITRQTIKDLPPIPKFRKQQSLQLQRPNYPIVRRSSAASSAVPTIPKLLSLELFNPATDDLDSDSSEPSSPDSIDSVISAPKSNVAPSLNEEQQNKKADTAEESSNEVLHTDDIEHIIKAQQQQYHNGDLKINPAAPNDIILNDDSCNILPIHANGSSAKTNTKTQQDCVEFAEKLSAQLLREIEDKTNRAECRSLDGIGDIAEYLDDPLCSQKKRNGEPRDLTALREELRERRLMLANLSTQPSLQQSPTSSSTSSLSSQTRSFTIHEEDEEEDEEENERSYTLQLYENCKISKFNYKRNRHYNLNPETAYLLQDDGDSSVRDEDEIEDIEHDIIFEEEEDEELEATTKTASTAEESKTLGGKNIQEYARKTSRNTIKCDSLEDNLKDKQNQKQQQIQAQKNKLKSDKQQKQSEQQTQGLENRQSTESWEHSNSSTTSLDSPSQGGATTHHRYYHVFREGELDALINHHVTSLHIVSSYYERASWCVVAEKVQVWTI
ncbi:uncharacterized protein LOC119675566 [Teleopsis dalmanni]|uniref:uncharacterized protein LOC119675566 n=1 Tax=Teleopsis dalmanni TaxID=139649 RepID=UPI0018CE228B|nr:uncharacterized protein LOC119675566 [Teleopsis dalmanni]